jgi:hypothetical protein
MFLKYIKGTFNKSNGIVTGVILKYNDKTVYGS